jgi:hypothetical protein
MGTGLPCRAAATALALIGGILGAGAAALAGRAAPRLAAIGVTITTAAPVTTARSTPLKRHLPMPLSRWR